MLSGRSIHGLELEQLPNVKIPRSLQEKYNVIMVSLYTFVDAFQAAYGAAVYQRIEYEDHAHVARSWWQLRPKWLLYNQSVFQDWI